jgi:hypothetical protein
MTTIATLADKVRVELGDLGKTFVTTIVADGTTARFNLHYSPLNESLITVKKNGTTLASSAYGIEESTGVMVLNTLPAADDVLVISGTYYRYFTAAEINTLVEEALLTHTANHKDSTGRNVLASNLPLIEEYPVVIHAVSLALYTLATDAAFDIDIQAPDGVTIPRAQRYRQLMEMVQTRKEQYRELCMLLGVGLYKIDVFTLNRISKATGRLIPIYTPQEVDDRSYPQRVNIEASSYGNKPSEWPTQAQELTAYQGRSFSTSLDFIGNYAGKSFTAKILAQRNSPLQVQSFTLTVDTDGTDLITAASRTSGSTTITFTTSAAHGLTAGNSVVITDVDGTANGYANVLAAPTPTSFTVTGTETTALALTGLSGKVETNVEKEYTFNISLTRHQTRLMAERTYWSISTVDPFTDETIEIKGANFFTVRAGTIVI